MGGKGSSEISNRPGAPSEWYLNPFQHFVVDYIVWLWNAVMTINGEP